MTIVFWSCIGVLLYAHLGYPLAVWFLARLKPRRDELPDPDPWPSVSLIIAAHNEEKVMAAKLANALALDYPPERLEIIVASDGSTDRTENIVAGLQQQGVRLLRIDGHLGKTAAQNAAAATAAGNILLFSDANAMYEADAIRRLARHFSRADVGCAEGRRSDFAEGSSATARHELTYHDWESRIKVWESRVLSCTGATGPMYAVRRSLYVPLDPAMVSDLMEPLMVMYRHRKRQVFEPRALCHEPVLGEMKLEFRRKVRIMTRCLNSLRMQPGVMDPRRVGWFAVQVVSHRLLRWLAPLFALGAFVANLFLLSHPVYAITMLLQAVFLALALMGLWLDRVGFGPGFLRLPYYFTAANMAALVAMANCLRGRNVITWQTQRG